MPEAVVEHRKIGFTSHDPRAFGRLAVRNRVYLFRKNFRRDASCAGPVRLLILLMLGQRLVNGEWAGARGLLEGVAESRGGCARSSRRGRSCLLAREARRRRALPRDAARATRARMDPSRDRPRGRSVRRARRRHRSSDRPRGGGDPPAAERRLRRRLRRDPPEVVHANGLKAALVSVLATMGTRLPVLWVKHDFSFDGRLAALVARRCRIVVTVSAAVAETFDPATRERKVRSYGGRRWTARRGADCCSEPPAGPSRGRGLRRPAAPGQGSRRAARCGPVLRADLPLRLAFIGGRRREHAFTRAGAAETGGGARARRRRLVPGAPRRRRRPSERLRRRRHAEPAPERADGPGGVPAHRARAFSRSGRRWSPTRTGASQSCSVKCGDAGSAARPRRARTGARPPAGGRRTTGGAGELRAGTGPRAPSRSPAGSRR